MGVVSLHNDTTLHDPTNIGMIKAGFAGGDKPRCLFRACVGRTKHVRMMPGGALEGYDT